MYYIKVSSSFDSAHFLRGYNGKCANIHGHHWVVEAKVKGVKLQKTGEKKGMLVDFCDLKEALKKLTDNFDHALLYEKYTLKPETIKALESENFRLLELDFSPTAENLAHYFYQLLAFYEEFKIKSVTVYETPENCAIYEVN